MSKRAADLPISLHEGEKIVIRGAVSDAIFWKAFGVFLIAICFALIAIPLGIFLGLVALLTFFYAALLKKFLLLIVTNERIFFRSGLLKVDTVQVRLDRVESVEIQRTIMGQFLSYGTVVLTGIGSRYSFIPYLANAAELRNVIDELLYQRDKKEKKE